MTGRPRLQPLAVDSLEPAQRDLYDAIAGGPRAAGPQLFALTDDAGALTGPFNAMLLQPRIGDALQALGAALRYGGRLPGRAREIAILVVAHAQDSAFEVYAHEAVGRAAGLDAAELAALRDRRYDQFEGDERLVAETADALATAGTVTDDGYTAVCARLGEAVLFELSAVVGYYRLLALQLRVFGVGVPSA